MPANPPPISFVQRVSAATAPDRDRFIDAVRAGSLLIVVLGHWLMATVVVQGLLARSQPTKRGDDASGRRCGR